MLFIGMFHQHKAVYKKFHAALIIKDSLCVLTFVRFKALFYLKQNKRKFAVPSIPGISIQELYRCRYCKNEEVAPRL